LISLPFLEIRLQDFLEPKEQYNTKSYRFSVQKWLNTEINIFFFIYHVSHNLKSHKESVVSSLYLIFSFPYLQYVVYSRFSSSPYRLTYGSIIFFCIPLSDLALIHYLPLSSLQQFTYFFCFLCMLYFCLYFYLNICLLHLFSDKITSFPFSLLYFFFL
jgi:hypothetical protein